MSIVTLNDVYFTYNRGAQSEQQAVRGVTLSVEEGEFVAVVGHNGSGKSTLARLMNGLLEPDSGDVTVAGLNTKNAKDLFDIRKTVGVVFQNPDNQMIATIIEDDVAFGPENLGLPSDEIRARVDWALKSVGMYEHREGTPFRLSGGQKQRIAIAGVLAIKPRVMILDESTSMLDPEGRAEVLKVVEKLNREENMSVVMITHFMEEALLADRIVVMNEGRVFMQGGKEIFSREEELKAIGLSVPLAARVAHALSRAGIPLKENITDPQELIDELCR
jgi:cobalt import ATP-binding protein cbiO 2